MDIDKLFKVPKLPIGGSKRKLPDNPSPEILKKLKMDTDSVSRAIPISDGNSKNHRTTTRSNRATVEEADDDNERGFAPGGDADYFAEEDEEGRFFGGGLTSEQKEILNIFDKTEGETIEDEAQDMSIMQVRRSLQALERAVNKNQDQRSKYPDEPSKFIDSEADLDSAIKALLPLSQSPLLAYPELVQSGSLTLLVGLLTHENVDIVIDVVELVANSALELLVDNLMRLNEQEEADRQGVFHVLGIFENVIGFNPALASNLVSKTKILEWLLNRIQSKTHDENRGYSAELLCILLQNSTGNKILLGESNGVELLLKVLSQFRRRDPIDADETEYMENLFDALCSAMSEPTIKKTFLDAEGPDLMILMIKEKHESKSRSIKVLDYAMSGPAGAPVCEAFVEALGLKTLFTVFMGKPSKRQKTNVETASEDIGHILGIISSLLTYLPSDSACRIRVLAKFVEGEYEKIDKLLELRDGARKRLKTTDSEVEKERQDILNTEGEHGLSSDAEDAFYIRRLDGGLFTLQTVDYILAWLMMEDDGIRNHALRMLDRRNQSLEDILQTLRLYHDHVDDDYATSGTEATTSQRTILQALISSLDATQTT
ncbi:DUF1716-domain-containing protein [Flammula alnicola]|nr:DUF1716-domain-containing protein [Flammula alnicola]